MNHKMYIAVLDEFPDFMTPTIVAHAVLGHHTDVYTSLWQEHAIGNEYTELYSEWLLNSFKKCVIRVNQKEFDKISQLENVGLFHENSTLGGKKSCAVIVVGRDIPNVLKYAKLWKPV